MQAARRIYVYLMTGISLGALVTGLTMLAAVLLEQLGLGPSGELIGGSDETLRQQLTVATALTVVSVPVWLVHWLAAERSVSPDRPGGLLELNAPERGLFFALALAILLAIGATGISSAIQGAIIKLGPGGEYRDVGGDLARGIVALAAWGYHVRVRGRDWQLRTLTHQAAFLPRVYRYGATLVGGLVLLFALTRLLELAGRAMIGAPTFDPGDGSPWWMYPLADGLSGAIVGGALWVGHWQHAARLVTEPGARGESERASRVRLAAFVAALVATAAATIGFLGTGIGAGLQLLLGVSEPTNAAEAIGMVVVPILSAAVFAAALALHARWLDAEPMARASADGAATVDRLRLYPVALVGLAFGAVGTAWLIGILIDAAFGSRAVFGDAARSSEFAQFAPYAALGWLAWAWRWRAVARRAAHDPAGEAASTTRRATSLLALAVSILVGIACAGGILYRVFGSLFGVELPGNPMSELSLPIAGLIVAAGVALWHGRLLRADGRLRPQRDVEAEPARRTVRLLLTGPQDGMDAALAALGSSTPSGYALEIEAGRSPDAAADASLGAAAMPEGRST